MNKFIEAYRDNTHSLSLTHNIIIIIATHIPVISRGVFGPLCYPPLRERKNRPPLKSLERKFSSELLEDDMKL